MYKDYSMTQLTLLIEIKVLISNNDVAFPKTNSILQNN
ncbi:truncated IS1272 transposase [Staphylococcus auricularis]|nr:truncated IS1272 transposase [Staphylococcus auricularis]